MEQGFKRIKRTAQAVALASSIVSAPAAAENTSYEMLKGKFMEDIARSMLQETRDGFSQVCPNKGDKMIATLNGETPSVVCMDENDNITIPTESKLMSNLQTLYGVLNKMVSENGKRCRVYMVASNNLGTSLIKDPEVYDAVAKEILALLAENKIYNLNRVIRFMTNRFFISITCDNDNIVQINIMPYAQNPSLTFTPEQLR